MRDEERRERRPRRSTPLAIDGSRVRRISRLAIRISRNPRIFDGKDDEGRDRRKIGSGRGA